MNFSSDKERILSYLRWRGKNRLLTEATVQRCLAAYLRMKGKGYSVYRIASEIDKTAGWSR